VSLEAFLQRVVGVLHTADVPFMLTGSLAAAFYGEPRATQDVDVVVDIEPNRVGRLADQLAAAGLYVSSVAAREAVTYAGQFNAIDPESGWKVDFIVRKERAFSRSEFERRKPVQLLGVEVPLTSVEDLVIAKLEWSELGDSEMQRQDVIGILQATGDALDQEYVEHWADRLGLSDAWKRVRASIK
jgi:hypothetical protein